MKSQIKNLIKYYRNSLADGERMDIRAKECEGGHEIDKLEDEKKLQAIYNVFYNEIKRQQKKEKKENSEEEEAKFPIAIFISPFYLSGKHEYAKKNTNSQKVYPFWIAAQLDQYGKLSINGDQFKPPWFVRSVLNPVATSKEYFPIVSSVETVDKCLDSTKFEQENWAAFYNSCEDFFKKVTSQEVDEYKIDNFTTHHRFCILKAKDKVTATGILNLYDDIYANLTGKELVKNFLKLEDNSFDELPNNSKLFESINHFGQFNNQYALSSSQRQSLLLFEQEQNDKTLAVNGPPGTGKTTLLQSVVANEVVKAVFEKEKPPMLLASSTNNQAITNILDNFGSEGSIERWLPDICSLGMYMISSDKRKQKEALAKGYQLLTRTNDTFSGHYFQNIHGADKEELEGFYLEKFNLRFKVKEKSLSQAVKYLKDTVLRQKQYIEYVIHIYKRLAEVEKKYFKISEIDSRQKELDSLLLELSKLEKKGERLVAYRDRFETFIESNKLLVFFSFIPFVKKRFANKLQLSLVDIEIDQLIGLSSVSQIRSVLLGEINRNKEAVRERKILKSQKLEAFKAVQEVSLLWGKVKVDLDEKWQNYLSSLKPKIAALVNQEYEGVELIEQLNRVLDISIRYDCFIYAMHYWEGRLVQRLQEKEIEINKGKESKLEQFELMSYITPLFISTFHSAPNFSSYWEKTSDKWIQKPIYELFDVLIVDEAGQVAPEVGVASFSLAKKAIVVGDIHQIEPVWNIAYKNIDRGNLSKFDFSKEYSFAQLEERGMLCSSGSLMKLAQNASAYKVHHKLKGTLLTEHRRCADELVEFSNKHIYDSLLIPKQGEIGLITYSLDDSNHLKLPALSYLNVNGVSEIKGSSSYNIMEAELIAKWILNYQNYILNTINDGEEEKKELHEIIAIITPFAEQKIEIYRQLRKYKLSQEITVGTVHALQGAEREIIIFSPVYGKNHQGGLFFDNGYNMLNVAITRAKNHFIVMGNMSLFDQSNTNKPSGALAKYLFAKPENELSSAIIFDKPLLKSNRRVASLKKHVDVLKGAFIKALDRVIIVSPFISSEAITSDGLVKKIQETIEKGVKVEIYTDKHLDMPNGKLKTNSAKGRELLISAGAKLNVLKGIHNKAVAIDELVLIEGSFNWLSAVRSENSPYFRHEVSQIILDSEAKTQIGQLMEELGEVKS